MSGKNKPITDLERGLTRGVCIGVAQLIRDWDEPVIAKDIMDGASITIDGMREAKVDGYDFKPISKFIREQEKQGGSAR